MSYLHHLGQQISHGIDNTLNLAASGESQYEDSKKFAMQEAEKQRQFEREMTDLAYQRSTPAHQMELYRQAGLNPSLMYGQMSDLATDVPSGAEANAPSPSSGRLDSLLGLGADVAMNVPTIIADIDLKRAQAANLRSQIPANQMKTSLMQANIDSLAADTKLALEKVNSEKTQQTLNKLLGKKTTAETTRILTETAQLIQSFPLKMQELNASIADLKASKELKTEQTRLVSEQADNYYKDLQMRWKSINAQIELMKAQKLDSYSSALLKSYQSEYYKAEKDYIEVQKGIKSDVGKAEAVAGIISRLLGSASGVISAIGSLRSGIPNFNNQPVGGSPVPIAGWDY